MALTHWKDFDDFFEDPWRHHCNLVPCWRRNWPWRHDSEVFPRDLFKDFRDIERRARELERKLMGDREDWILKKGEGFELSMDVKHFSPGEITVSTTDNSVTIEGKHEKHHDNNGFVSRQFTRRYTLPEGCDGSKITSEISSDGFLTVKAPPPKALPCIERNVQVVQTGLKHNQNKAIENKKVRF